MRDYTGRFTGRADAYSRYRPRYPRAILAALRSEIGLAPSWVVADVGSGTGILSELFLANGNAVIGVEPNDDMRSSAESKLAPRYPGLFKSVDGRAERTTLGPGSVDLVVVGQALHWFDIEGARAEFSRILRSGGSACVVYNNRVSERGFMEAYGRVVRSFRGSTPREVPRINSGTLNRLFSAYRTLTFSNNQRLNLAGLLGRLSSASYAPSPGDAVGMAKLEASVRRLHSRYSKGGRVTLRYVTRVYLGSVEEPVSSPRTASWSRT